MSMVEIQTPRFTLRELTLADVTQRYLGWFADPVTQKYIAAAVTTTTLDDLRAFVTERLDRADVLFLGIFERETGLHIGNVKFEPVDSARGFAVMGIMLGDPSFRGKGVSPEVIAAGGKWLCEHRGIAEIVLGVRADNVAARQAYAKIGFLERATPYVTPDRDALTMVWRPC